MYNDDKYPKRDCCPLVCGNGDASCNTTEIKETLDVCVPVTVEPSVTVGDVVVSVIGQPCVRPVNCRHFNQIGQCKFVVTQKLCVQFPITFNATAGAYNGLSTDCFNEKGYPEPYYS